MAGNAAALLDLGDARREIEFVVHDQDFFRLDLEKPRQRANGLAGQVHVGLRQATDIRTAWPELDERRRMALVMSLYPNTQKNPKLAKTVVKMLDTAMGAEITEVLDTKASNATSQWDTSDPDMIKFNFTASNGVRYQLDFLEPYIGPDEMSPYDFFDSDEVYNKSKFVSFEQITQDMKGGYPVAKQGIEGTGSAAEVFGIVVNAIIQYVKKARPALLYFQAAEPNRRALYARMIRRILPGLPGWDSTADAAGQFAIYNRRAIKSAMNEQGMAEQVTRQMSQGGLRASYQNKYNQPMMEDYLDEARS